VLIAGVQGCGKSLAAKVIARTWHLPLLKLDAGRLYDKYIGESEKNLRHALSLAESMAPVLLWIEPCIERPRSIRPRCWTKRGGQYRFRSRDVKTSTTSAHWRVSASCRSIS